MKRLLTSLGVLAALVFAAPTFAQSVVTEPVGFQGRLAKPDGTPVADGTFQITFSVYNALTGGTLLWQQVSPSVPVHNGTFAVKLDFTTGFQSGSTLDSTFRLAAPYLEITVGNDAPLAPRQKFTNVVYSYFASTANTVPDGSITANKLASGVLDFSNIGGTLGAGQLAAGSITGDKIAAGTITSSNLSTSLQSVTNNLLFRQLSVTFDLSLLGQTPNYPGYSGVVFKSVVQGNYAYIPASGGNAGNVLYVTDVSNPAAPVIKTSIATAGSNQGIANSGNYVYVASGNTLQVFDVTNPLVPVLLGSTAIPASAANTSYPLAVSGNTLCILTASGLAVYDVSSPASPAVKSTIATANGPKDVAMQGKYAYVCTQDPSHTLQIFDVSVPTMPVLKGQSTSLPTYANSLTVQGNYVYVANYLTNNTANSPTLQIYDVSDPTTPVVKSTTALSQPSPTVAVSGNTAYVLLYSNGRNTGGVLQAYDITSPVSPSLLKSVSTNNNQSTSIVVKGGRAYVIVAYNLQVYSLYTAALDATLTLTGTLTTPGITFGDGTTQTTAATSFSGTAAGGDLTGTYPNPTIAANAVTTTKIADSAITTTKIADSAVTAAKIASGVIPTALPPSGAAGGDLTGTYPNPTIAANAVNTAKIADSAITTTKIADSAVTAAKIASSVIPTALPPNGAAGGDLAGSTYPNPTIAAGAITAAKIAAGVIPTTLPPSGTAGGDLTGTYPNPVIGANKIDNTRLLSDSVSLSKVSGNLVFALPSGQNVDQQQTTTGSNQRDSAFWQSFTAGTSGYLLAIDAVVSTYSGTTPSVLTIYQGTGTGGTVLTSQNITITHGSNTTYQHFQLNAPVALTSGQKYTFGMTSPVINTLSYYASVTFPSGGSSYGGNYNTAFKTYVSGSGAVSLYVASGGTFAGSVVANGVTLTSDARYKTHVATLDNALDEVLQLQGVSYEWDRVKWSEKHFADGRQIGFIAQEIEKIFPELVSTDAQGYKSVNYTGIVPVLVEAVKTLNAKLDDKQRQIDELKAQNARISVLEKQITELMADRKSRDRN